MEMDVFLATQVLNASSLRSVSAGVEHEAETRLTMQRTQGPFEGVGPYVRSEPEGPSPSLQSTAAESCRFLLRRRNVEVAVA